MILARVIDLTDIYCPTHLQGTSFTMLISWPSISRGKVSNVGKCLTQTARAFSNAGRHHVAPAATTERAHDHEQIASLISFMDAAWPYCDDTAVTVCGIPAIRLDGKPEDYRAVTAACVGLVEQWASHLRKYFDELLPVLDRIARQDAGEERDVNFWQSMYKYQLRSGSAAKDGSLVPRHEHPQY
jgi:hypothetical protein